MVTGGGTYDDGQPIYLANLSAMEFEMVLAWLEHARWQPCSFSPSLPQLIALLQSARFLMMRSLLRWAINRLENYNPPMSTIQKITLSQEIPLLKDSWLRAPVGALITTSLENILGLSSELNASLHTTVLSKIMLARETLNARRILLAYSIPKDDGSISPAAECSAEHHSTRCFQIWAAVWWGKVPAFKARGISPFSDFRWNASSMCTELHPSSRVKWVLRGRECYYRQGDVLSEGLPLHPTYEDEEWDDTAYNF
ncbi:hypothetical protein C8R41DRAFT_919673 [Lentinula lateritia]|uniref:Uncharacterized protein n=1 Tax=Lentinula lateritia TaxID=40482 RepID=A0ABQ8VG37_9AGAR|nr:hypothetical protein C8R41DRAFT_919673 [Lentinula lateritia]